jgi:hypothetical protein
VNEDIPIVERIETVEPLLTALLPRPEVFSLRLFKKFKCFIIPFVVRFFFGTYYKTNNTS